MKKIKAFLNRYINGTKGAVSLFLALLMVPFVSIAGMLVNAGRINSSVAIFDEALCNASDSTLGTYDKFLRSRFALMAVSQDVTSGATKFGKSVTGYTADAFINDTFQYYMEKNLGALSGTYDSDSVSAIGVYPLADRDILKSAVAQSSKIMVPAKLVVDWGSIDDMLAKLTKPFDALGAFVDVLGSGADAITALDKLSESEEKLKKKIDECNTAITNYNTAYNNFVSAVNAYNTTVGNISYWRGEVARLTPIFADLEQKAASVTSQIESVKSQIETLKKDKSVDHSAEITQLNTKLSTLETEREKVAPGYSQTKSDLEAAKKSLQSNVNALPGKRSDVNTKKSDYYNKIIKLRDLVKGAGDAVAEFQKAGEELSNKTHDLVADTVTLGFEVAENKREDAKKQLDEENQYYSYQKTLADAEGRTEYSTHYYNMIQENNSTKLNLEQSNLNAENLQTTLNSANKTASEVAGEIDKFVEAELKSKYYAAYDELDSLSVKVNGIVVPTTETKISNYAHYYTVDLPLSKEDVDKYIKAVEDKVNEDKAGWAVFKAIIGFFKALIKIKLWSDPDLNSNIDVANYESIGGLPSQRNGVSYISPYDAADATVANNNKAMLNSYSGVEIYEMSEASGLTTVEQLQEYMDQIATLTDPFKLKNAKALWDAATGAVDCIVELASSDIVGALKAAGRGLANRALLVGYISYNTANRTTYEGSALSGAKYNLPTDDAMGGYLFKGAETEYIFKGSMSEKTNQKSVFNSLWVVRMLCSLPGVLADATVQSLASSLGAATFGIMTVVVYIVYVVLEGFIDTLVLVNSGTVPAIKTYVFASPSGITKLLTKICTLKLSEAQKQSIYETSAEKAKNLNTKLNDNALEKGKEPGKELNLPTYAENKTAQDALAKSKKIVDILEVDYTKSVWVLLLLFGNTYKMLRRLADIIQMEGTYYYRGTNISKSKFDLAKSYTYLRAQGNFYTSAFLRVGEYEGSTSKNRVIYNGY